MEIEETIEQLIFSEKEARNVVDAAKMQAKKTIEMANEEGEALLENKKSEVNKLVQQMIDKAQEEANLKSKEAIQKALRSIEELKQRYSTIREEFVSDFVKSAFDLRV